MHKKRFYFLALITIIIAILIILGLVYSTCRHAECGFVANMHCGLYDQDGNLHSTCQCIGFRYRQNDLSYCSGFSINWLE